MTIQEILLVMMKNLLCKLLMLSLNIDNLICDHNYCCVTVI